MHLHCVAIFHCIAIVRLLGLFKIHVLYTFIEICPLYASRDVFKNIYIFTDTNCIPEIVEVKNQKFFHLFSRFRFSFQVIRPGQADLNAILLTQQTLSSFCLQMQNKTRGTSENISACCACFLKRDASKKEVKDGLVSLLGIFNGRTETPIIVRTTLVRGIVKTSCWGAARRRWEQPLSTSIVQILEGGKKKKESYVTCY